MVDFYRALGVPEDRLTMIYSGIDEEEPPPVDPAAVRAEFGFAADAPLVLFAGRLAEQKGVGDLLKALDVLQHVQADVRNADRRRRSPPLSAGGIGLPLPPDDRVRFLGHREDVPRLLAAADLVVLPSAYEGLPNLVLEAMLFRKPVVATAAPGTTEVVLDGQTGVLVPIGNPPLLARAIRDVVRDGALAQRLGQAGREHVLAHFATQTMIDRFSASTELAATKGRFGRLPLKRAPNARLGPELPLPLRCAVPVGAPTHLVSLDGHR